MAGALVEDETGLGKTFTLVAGVMIPKLVTEQGVIGLPFSIFWVHNRGEWVILANNDVPGLVGQEQGLYPHQRLSSVSSHRLDIQTSPPHGHPAVNSVLEPILMVTMPRVAVTFKTGINEMTDGTHFKLGKLLHAENANLTHKDLNTTIEEAEN
jgi:hypothetical protein